MQIFSKADYAAPTTSVAHARAGMSSNGNVSDKRSFAASAVISRGVSESKKPASRKPRRRRPLFAILSLLMVAVGIVTAGVVFLAFPLFASASVTIGPQVHTLQQVYTIAAQPSLSSIDLADAAIPAFTKVATLNGSLSGQATGQRCFGFFFQCQQVVASDDVLNVSAQLRQSLSSQLSAQMDSQLQAAGASAIGSIQFTDLSEVNTPDIGAVSDTVNVTLAEQGSVEYVNNADVQRLTRLLLARELGPNTILVNSTVRIGQPVIEEVSDSGAVTMKVAVAGVEEYNYTPAQLEAMQNHIKGMTLADARLYLRQQPGVDANSVSISIHTLIGEGNTLPYSASQIKIISINPTTLPSATLPVIATPTDTTGSLTPNV